MLASPSSDHCDGSVAAPDGVEWADRKAPPTPPTLAFTHTNPVVDFMGKSSHPLDCPITPYSRVFHLVPTFSLLKNSVEQTLVAKIDILKNIVHLSISPHSEKQAKLWKDSSKLAK